MTTVCPACGTTLHAPVVKCPQCGAGLGGDTRRGGLPAWGFALLGFALALAVSNSMGVFYGTELEAAAESAANTRGILGAVLSIGALTLYALWRIVRALERRRTP